MTRDEMDDLTGDTDNKSEKIRRLYAAGVAAADIGRYLDIRYQHVYNVLLRAGVIQKGGAREAAAGLTSPVVVLPIGPRGMVQFPDELLKAHGLEEGQGLV